MHICARSIDFAFLSTTFNGSLELFLQCDIWGIIHVPWQYKNSVIIKVATGGADTAYPSAAHVFTPGFSGVRVTRSLVFCVSLCRSSFFCLPLCCYSIFSFMCMFCRLLFVLLYFFFWPLCSLFFFDIWILITSLVSSNSSLIYDLWLAFGIFKPFLFTQWYSW
jgi:hypothetical protein